MKNKQREYGFTPLEIKRKHRSSYKFLTGFTLVELLISVSIFAIIGVVLYSSYRGGVITWRRINSETTFQQKIRYAFDRMSRDFGNMAFLSNLSFEGSADKLKFVSLIRSSEGEGLDIARVSYYLSLDGEGPSGSAIVRAEEAVNNALSLEVTEEEPAEGKGLNQAIEREPKKKQALLDGVSDLKFSYLALYKGSSSDEELEYEWLDFWEEEEGLPLGIKIEFTLTNPEDKSSMALSRRIYIPAGEPIEVSEGLEKE